MLKIANALSIINMIAAAEAVSNEHERKHAYMQFTSTFGGIVPSTHNEFNGRLHNFGISETYIKKCNERAVASGHADAVYCGHNRFSDWTDEEFEQFVSGLHVDASQIVETAVGAKGRRLEDLPNNVNHK